MRNHFRLRFFVGLVGIHLFLHGILGFQKNIDHRAAQAQLAMARPVQKGFKQVRRVRQRSETESGRTTLDRMCGTEDGIELLAVRRLHIQIEEQLLHIDQKFAGFDKKFLGKLADVHDHSDKPVLFSAGVLGNCW